MGDGVDVWWDRRIPASTDWRAKIAESLAAADCILAVWSRNTQTPAEAKWVTQEAEDAERRGVLACVLIDDVLPPLGLRHIQAADLVDWHGDREEGR